MINEIEKKKLKPQKQTIIEGSTGIITTQIYIFHPQKTCPILKMEPSLSSKDD